MIYEAIMRKQFFNGLFIFEFAKLEIVLVW